ncbi:zinc-binding dehydrogenase [Streptomyces adelaidensis]|uniref:zinc-binding dehydrogenase n=1 Tax=Streptomyces adelaidensis TaxID=2796465 RepID=UPI001F438194|nr:zinc-binding dehydrogenase [Streptomyces adelaidensis]
MTTAVTRSGSSRSPTSPHTSTAYDSPTAAPAAPRSPGYTGLATAAGLATEGRFTVPLHEVLPLERGAEAHALSATGRARGKIVLSVR